MSVSLQGVLEGAGFDIENNVDDALWLVSKQDEFVELIELCEDVIEKPDEEEDDE